MTQGPAHTSASGAACETFGTERWLMARALDYATFGLGTVAPNPSVGAVVFDHTAREVVGVGWTQPGGRPHAEPEALKVAGARARGATMAVTLEPCVHYGRSPPCTNAIIASGISRVIYAVADPDPRVAGRGAAALRAAGISVVRADEDHTALAHWITRGHILRVTERRPFVQLKLAVGGDGQIRRGGGPSKAGPVWVTGPLARAAGHVLRAQADAIMVGSGTVRDDDPDLRCRLPGCQWRSPVRVVVGRAALPSGSRLVRSAHEVPVLHYAASETVRGAAGITTIATREVAGHIWLPSVLEDLVARGVTRLLVEGGPQLWASFGASGLVDEAVIFHARGERRLAGEEDALAVCALYLPGFAGSVAAQRRLGDDMMFALRPKWPGKARAGAARNALDSAQQE